MTNPEIPQKTNPLDREKSTHYMPYVDKFSQQGWLSVGSDYDGEENEEEEEEPDESDDEGGEDGGEEEPAPEPIGDGGDGDVPDGGFEE